MATKTAFLVATAFFTRHGEWFIHSLQVTIKTNLFAELTRHGEWCCLVAVQASAEIYLLGLVLPCYGAVSGRCLCLACARLGIDLYGIGSRGRTTWETSFGPHSLAEIFVAEPDSFKLRIIFGKTGVSGTYS